MQLCQAPVLQLPNAYKPFILTTDWSHKGMGAVLSQLTEEGVEHPICYASRSCNPAEQNYSSFDGECLAVVWATNYFRSYLFGNSFTLITDHEPLRWLMTTQKLTGKRHGGVSYSRSTTSRCSIEPGWTTPTLTASVDSPWCRTRMPPSWIGAEERFSPARRWQY